MLSPKLAARAKGGGIERRGVWGGTKGTLFPPLEMIKTSVDAASDHALLWVDLDFWRFGVDTVEDRKML